MDDKKTAVIKLICLIRTYNVSSIDFSGFSVTTHQYSLHISWILFLRIIYETEPSEIYSKTINRLNMQRYKNLSGDSGVYSFEIGADYIRVKFFGKSRAYKYSNLKAGIFSCNVEKK